MKHVLLLATLFVLAVATFGQKSNVTTAQTLMNKKTGEDMKKAAATIELATADPTTSSWYKTYQVKGDIYHAMYMFPVRSRSAFLGMDMAITAAYSLGTPPDKKTTATEEIWVFPDVDFIFDNNAKVLTGWKIKDTLHSAPLPIAYEAYMKAYELAGTEKKPDAVRKKIIPLLYDVKNPTGPCLKNDFVSWGAEAFDKADYANALLGFEYAMKISALPEINMKDTVITYYCGLAAQGAGQCDKAIKYMTDAIAMGYDSVYAHHTIIACLIEAQKYDEALVKAQKNFERFPDKEITINDLINIYVALNQREKSYEYLEMAIANNPGNYTYYQVLGYLYEDEHGLFADQAFVSDSTYRALTKLAFVNRNKKTNEPDAAYTAQANEAKAKTEELDAKADATFSKAESSYMKSLEIQPNYGAYSGIGIMYYNRALRLQKRIDLVPPSDSKNYDRLKGIQQENFSKAKDNLEAAYKQNPTDGLVKSTLISSYMRLGMSEKANNLK